MTHVQQLIDDFMGHDNHRLVSVATVREFVSKIEAALSAPSVNPDQSGPEQEKGSRGDEGQPSANSPAGSTAPGNEAFSSMAPRFIPKRACEGAAPVIPYTDRDVVECPHVMCGLLISSALVDHPVFGFKAACRLRTVAQGAAASASGQPLTAASPKFHRYTITSEGASLGYFRLVEDPEGAWVTWAEVESACAASQVLSDDRPPVESGKPEWWCCSADYPNHDEACPNRQGEPTP